MSSSSRHGIKTAILVPPCETIPKPSAHSHTLGTFLRRFAEPEGPGETSIHQSRITGERTPIIRDLVDDRQEQGRLFLLSGFLDLLCAGTGGVVPAGKGTIPAGDLGDSDCYMHLIRASDLYETGRWYDPVIERSNAPYGNRLHWTRPFDLLLLAGAVPGSLLTSFSSSLFWWGVVISPVILIALLLALHGPLDLCWARMGPPSSVFFLWSRLACWFTCRPGDRIIMGCCYCCLFCRWDSLCVSSSVPSPPACARRRSGQCPFDVDQY